MLLESNASNSENSPHQTDTLHTLFSLVCKIIPTAFESILDAASDKHFTQTVCVCVQDDSQNL